MSECTCLPYAGQVEGVELCEGCRDGQRIAELKAENRRLKQNLYDWNESINEAHDALAEAPELNPSNYDYDQVCELNRQADYAYRVLHAAIFGEPEEWP